MMYVIAALLMAIVLALGWIGWYLYEIKVHLGVNYSVAQRTLWDMRNIQAKQLELHVARGKAFMSAPGREVLRERLAQRAAQGG